MANWWNNLSAFGQTTFAIGVAATFVMIVFLVLMLFGIEDGHSFDGGADDPSDMDDIANDEPLGQFSGLRVLTLRGALAFLGIGGFAAFYFEDKTGPIWATVIGVILGAIAAVLLAYAFRASLKLESEGNLDYKNAIGATATVYLRIPPKRSGKGKVTLTLQERFIETEAITDEDEIPNKSIVEVIGVIDETTLIVKIKK
ncbi:MAG: hypothetical protein PHY42_02455 [Bacilli bacterium]|nr:hypothetical protein [Bacilli bacterium]